MLKKFLSRQYLESVSTADLISLADDYGIDIPDNLNRRFIIGELLEAAEEDAEESTAEDIKVTDDESAVSDSLPKTYNHTKITALLHNPAWAFVFWDIREADLTMLKKTRSNLFLHVIFFESEDAEKPSDTFDIQVGTEDREQYVLLPAGKKYFMINLEYTTAGGQPDILAFSKRVEIPSENAFVQNIQPGKKIETNPLVELSGMEHLLHDQFVNHRQAF